MTAYLQLPDGARTEISDGLILGRVQGCDVVVPDAKASRKHARIVFEGGVAEIEDLDSSNGTLLNGKPVQRRVLRDRDVIRIGTTEIEFRDGVAAPPPPQPSEPAPGQDLLGAGGDDELTAAFAGEEIDVTPRAEPKPEPAAPDDQDLLDAFAEEELDLGGGATTPEPSPPPRKPAPKPTPRAEPERPDPPASSGAEIEDLTDLVQVRKREVEQKPAPAAAKGRGPKPGPGVKVDHGVLQFSSHKADRGLLGEDVGQTGGLKRAALVLIALAVAIGAGYFAMQFASG